MRIYSVVLALTAAAYAVGQQAPEPAAPATDAAPVAPQPAGTGPVTFKLPTVGVQTVTHVTLDPVDGHITGTYTTQEGGPAAGGDKQAFAGELEAKQWAGELEPRIAGDKSAFAGLDDYSRLAVNAVRISDGTDPVVADVPLKLAAYRLAKDLATDDKPDTIDAKMIALNPSKYATEEGFKGTEVKYVTHVEEADVARKVTDHEAAIMSAVGKWSASKDALAGLEDPSHKYIGSMGYLSASGRAYYVSLLGK